MDSAKNQLADKLKTANNVLVTVSRNPSVDQLSALLGLTLALNKLGKHAAAVFSGEVPSTIEFLQPEETIEKNTDSLRDFIIALDKSKADKLRYKVEDNVVRIFITPYKTSISQDDLDFSQGDFNVDVVVALGVRQQDELDEAITSHGRILHDAVVTSINTKADAGLGSLNWHDEQTSSLSELVTELIMTIGKNLLDGQIATALLTGIVSETNRFGNDKTTSQTMSASAVLLAAGANQQLVASKLEEAPQPTAFTGTDTPEPPVSDGEAAPNDNGMLHIEHTQSSEDEKPEPEQQSKEEPEPQEPPIGDAKPFELPEPLEAVAAGVDSEKSPDKETPSGSPRPMVTEPPQLGGTLTANTQTEQLDPSTDPFSMPKAESPQLLDRPGNNQPTIQPPADQPQPEPPAPAITPPPVNWVPPAAPQANPPLTPPEHPAPPKAAEKKGKADNKKTDDKKQSDGTASPTLTDLEASVHSPHLNAASDTANLDTAREEVSKALSGTTAQPEAIKALNAQPLGNELHPDNNPLNQQTSNADDNLTLEQQIPGLTTSPDAPPVSVDPSPGPQVVNPNAPPPVPPPLPINLGTPGSNPPQK